ncbi:lysylphosphatidylglycerol synthase transmembrane domain-containing protein [Rhodoferax sp. BLA1]|uniref:lysylphosphatidylglycerol synthase transmembrane domain-containing protein n=1 Tax=Rhodoferax sp. BLA1 TaxID=2576062 RepID=UPI0015D2C73F|nr:lysylphosphatidylglycerol synthase transmembrane domain-containing protein [Rhodoferax sp. BLA1]
MSVTPVANAEAAQAARQARNKERRSLAIRLAISVLLILWLGWHLDLSALSQRLTTLDSFWVAMSFVTVLAAVLISAWKWGLILTTRGFALPYTRLLRHYFVGLFFNNVLPTTVGGDAVRAWETSKDTGETPEAIGSVVTERLIAGMALGVTALLGLPFMAFSPRLLGLVGLFLVIDVALVALFLLPKVAEGIVGKLVPPRLSSLHENIHQTVQVVRATLKNRRLFIKVALYSVAFQILVAAVNACIFKAMGVPVTLAQCVIFTPMIFTVTMLPISLSGFGVREAAYWYFFSQVGVSQADAVAASLLFFVIVGVSSLPGALLFSLKRPLNQAAKV